MQRYLADHQIPWSEFSRRWTPDDQDRLLAVLEDESQRCGECGSHSADWVDPTTGRRHDMDQLGPTTVLCYGCEALAMARGTSEESARKTFLVPLGGIGDTTGET